MTAKDLGDFGRAPAFPGSAVYDPIREQVNSGYEYGCEMGLNIQQLVWLQIYAAVVGSMDTTYTTAAKMADTALPIALARLKELA